MNKRPFDWKRDGVGLALFVAGAFVSTLMVMALRADQPLDQIAGSAKIAQFFANAFGAFPCLVLAAGVGFLGARAFLTASEGEALRHALGLIGCTLGLSILCGAFSDTGGGRIGLLIGGKLGLATHATLGALLGLGVCLGAIWFTWFRQPTLLYEEQIRSSIQERPELEDPGVTAAEAAGLIPEDLPQVPVSARKSNFMALSGAPPSPYPEDVRLKGQVPAGARPIESAYVHTAAPRVSPEPLPQSSLERTQPFHPGSDLAAAASAAVPAAAPAARTLRPLPPGVRPIESAEEELTEREEEFVPIEEPRTESAPLRPSWEQTGLGEDDEPVDAYGTPLSLVETLRKAREEMKSIPEEPLVAESEGEEELEEEVEEEEAPEAPVEEPQAIAQTTIFDFTGEPQAGIELFPEEIPEVEEPIEEVTSEQIAEPQGEIEIAIGEEPEVVLQPQAAPAERAHKSLSVDPQRAKLLAEAGCLFVERGRVAVSMLQKQYGMDFDDACRVLDELQDLGLIGPYLGGQSRDILLTRDQWLEKAGAT